MIGSALRICVLAAAMAMSPVCAEALSSSGLDYLDTLAVGDPDAKLGMSVAISGDLAIVNAPSLDSINPGYASIFRRTGNKWEMETSLAHLQAPHDFNAYLGCNGVAIQGEIAVIGEPNIDGEKGDVLIFRHKTGKTWSLETTLKNSAGGAYDAFGCSVGISNGVVVVGAPGKGKTGAGFVYSLAKGIWTEEAQLTATEAAEHDAVGFSVAISDNEIVLGGQHASSDIGSAYLFRKSGTHWEEVFPLQFFEQENGLFGASVSISKGKIVVGSPGVGDIFIYNDTSSSWLESVGFPDSGCFTNNFGSSVAIDGYRIAVGAIDCGTVVLAHTSAKVPWDFVGELDAGATSRNGGAVAISGATVISGVFPESTALVAEDDLIFADGME